MSNENEQNKQPLPYELPWPKELSQGLAPGVIWMGVSFTLFLMHWMYGLFSVGVMFIFYKTQRNTPVGKGRKHYVQGRLAYRKQNFTEALEHFYQAVKIVPEATAVYPVIGDLNFMLGDLPQAKSAYHQFFQRNDDDHHMRIWYAGQLMEQSLFTEAIKELKTLPSSQRKNNQVANVLAVCYLKSNQPTEALQVLEPVARQGGTDEHQLTTQYLLAKSYLQTRRKEQAHEILQKLEREHPGFEDVPQLLQTF